jgi:hypothetical protein
MAKFSGKDRLELALYGPALLGVWWYFVPDYATFSETPLGQLTFSDIMNDDSSTSMLEGPSELAWPDRRYTCSMIINPIITNPSIPKDRDIIDIAAPKSILLVPKAVK